MAKQRRDFMLKGFDMGLTSGPVPVKVVLRDHEDYKFTVSFRRPLRAEAMYLTNLQARSALEWDEWPTELGSGRPAARPTTFRRKDAVPLSEVETHMLGLCLIDSSLVWGDGEKVFVPGENCRTAADRDPDKIMGPFIDTLNELPQNVVEAMIDAMAHWHPEFDLRGRTVDEKGQTLGEGSEQPLKEMSESTSGGS